MDETAWLIEHADQKNPGCVTGEFLGFEGRVSGSIADGKFVWMPLVTYAIRFARREDAEKFIGAYLLIQDKLPHGDTLPGFRTGDPRPVAIEHSWCY